MHASAEEIRREVARKDDRWLLAVAAMFLGSLAILGIAYAIYHVTGPHPLGHYLLRRARFWARWLLPGV